MDRNEQRSKCDQVLKYVFSCSSDFTNAWFVVAWVLTDMRFVWQRCKANFHSTPRCTLLSSLRYVNTNCFTVGAASGWDNQQTMGGGSSPWLLLRNLPPQVDGNTLKTLCSQHGPLQSFFVNTNSGQALIRYTTKDEALKAQKSLNSCTMYEATITAEFVDESEVRETRCLWPSSFPWQGTIISPPKHDEHLA